MMAPGTAGGCKVVFKRKAQDLDITKDNLQR